MPALPATSSPRSRGTVEPGQWESGRKRRRKARGVGIPLTLMACWRRVHKARRARERISQMRSSIPSCLARKAPLGFAKVHACTHEIGNVVPPIETYLVEEILPAGRSAFGQQQDGHRQHFRLKVQPRRAPLRDRLQYERGCLLVALRSYRLKQKYGGAQGTQGEAQEGRETWCCRPCPISTPTRSPLSCWVLVS